ELCSVEGRNQRGALAAGCDIAAAEVGNDVDATALCQQSRGVQLNGVAQLGAVSHRLAVCSYGAYVCGRYCAAGQNVVHCCGIEFCQALRSQRGASELIMTRSVQCQQLFPQRCLQGKRFASKHAPVTVFTYIEYHGI